MVCLKIQTFEPQKLAKNLQSALKNIFNLPVFAQGTCNIKADEG